MLQFIDDFVYFVPAVQLLPHSTSTSLIEVKVALIELYCCNVAAEHNKLIGEVIARKSVTPDPYTMHKYFRNLSKQLNTRFWK